MASIQFNQSSTLKSLQFSLFQFRGHQLSVWPDPGKDLRASGQTDRSWCIVVLWHSSWSHTSKWNIYCLTVSNTWPCLTLITRRLLTRYIRFLAGTICVSLDAFWFPSPPPFNLSTLHLNGGEKNLLCVVLRRSPEGAAPFKVSQTSRGAGRTTASFNTSQRLERGAAVLRIHAAQQKTPLWCVGGI